MGNYKTSDEVLRRELRQMEGAMYSSVGMEESKRRLSNLGYLQDVQVKAIPIPESPNIVDLECHVTETSSATANFQVGFSDAYGLLYGANLNQTNDCAFNFVFACACLTRQNKKHGHWSDLYLRQE